MAGRPDLRRNAALFGEGIVGGDAAGGVQADHLAQIVGHVLRRVELLPFARGDEQILAIWRKGEAVREMAAAGHFRVLLPDDLQSLDSRRVALDQLRLADDGAERVARSGLDPTQIDGAARHEIGGEDDVAEAALDRKSTRLNSS